jgi:hypothetical protein
MAPSATSCHTAEYASIGSPVRAMTFQMSGWLPPSGHAEKSWSTNSRRAFRTSSRTLIGALRSGLATFPWPGSCRRNDALARLRVRRVPTSDAARLTGCLRSSPLSHCFQAFDLLFPTAGTWFRELYVGELRVLKAFPASLRGIGVLRHMQCADVQTAAALGVGRYAEDAVDGWLVAAQTLIGPAMAV